jgi:hypothetical protein
MEKVIPALLEGDPDSIVERATIVRRGELTEAFSYLESYLKGE